TEAGWPIGPGEQLLTRTALLKAGYSRATIAAMTPVAERQNRHSGDWYPLSSAS
ncbi:hypothetical protein OP063_004451, partial [Salmonella enterica subsp. enterica]|nr:hypothetical protein [Salmonella enterica]EKC4582501.1 hypothetical protein [Salmonella enterica subsp. enterica]EKC4689366.1 hypothetical protein [Salmonella enterica subsp. enterica]